jgi:hypothetical protein
MLTHYQRCLYRRSWKCYGLRASIEFHHGFGNWDLNTFQEFKEMKGIMHKRKKTARNILSRKTWQFFCINAVVSMICMARVNQHPPVHHEGWMVSG